MATARKRSQLGTIWKTQSGTFSARYEHNDTRHTPGHRFPTFKLADEWLKGEELLIARDQWTPPAQRRADHQAEDEKNALTLGTFAEQWISGRQVRGRPIRPRTAEQYRQLMASPTWLHPLADKPLTSLTRAQIGVWYRTRPDKPTTRQHAYALLRSLLRSAVRDGIIDTNPADIPGASAPPRPAKVELFTPEQITLMADLMPPKHKLLVLLAAWCGLRFGELSALRRSDIEVKGDTAIIHVTRGVVTIGNKRVEGPTKSDAGVRDVAVPPHIVPELKAHLKNRQWTQWGKAGLVFPPSNPATAFLTPAQAYGSKPRIRTGCKNPCTGYGFYFARHQIGRDDLSFHKLRHFAATSMAVAGATDRELLDAMGHSDMAIALRYQHAATSRMQTLAERMSELAGGQ